MRRRAAPPAPAKSSEADVELTVERIGTQGDGIAPWHGESVFLPFTVPGDRVRARLGPRRGDGRAGRVVERLADGPGRVAPPCPHFGRCGGCALQHLDPARYEAVKLAGLHGALARVGIGPGVVAPLHILSPARRRARLGLARPADLRAPGRVGFRERFSHALVDVQACPVLAPGLLALVAALRRRLPALLPPASAAEATMTLCDSGIDLVVEAAPAPTLAAVQALADLAEDEDLARVTWRTPADDIPIVERRKPRLLLSGVAVALPPGAFVQANAEAERLLVAEIERGIGDLRPALDLYAGLGAFSFALARGGRVHAVDGDATAIAALAQAAAGMAPITVERRDLAHDPLPPEALARYRAAVFDPPRAGAVRQAEALAQSPLATVVAVSCNPATFARDARRLIDGGFRLERVVPIDQFVWTPHLELVATFRR